MELLLSKGKGKFLEEEAATALQQAGELPEAQVSTRTLGETMRGAVRNTERWEKAPYAYPRS